MGHRVDFEDLNNIAIGLFIIASFVTSYRCFARYTKKLWGWDDTAALLSLFFFIFFVIGSSYLAKESTSRNLRIAGSYILMVGFYTPVWGGRISIVLTVLRITPWPLQRRILLWIAASFVLMWAMLLVQGYWVCEISQPGWKQIPDSICVLPRAVPIAQVITTVISDSALIATPLLIAKGVKVRAVYYRLFFIFSVSIATTIASVAHAILVVVAPGVMEAIFGGVEAAVSIIVCSMSVIIPAILRAIGVGDPFMQEDTVDLNFSTNVDIARFELGLQMTCGTVTAIAESVETEGALSTMTLQHRSLADMNVRTDKKHRLTAQVSDGSLGSSKPTKGLPLTDECDVTRPAAQARNLPVLIMGQSIEAEIEEKHAKRNTT